MRPDSPGALRVAFAGTPEFARTALAAIHAVGFEPPLVLTQPDRPAGRGQKLQTSAVKRFALEQGLALAQPRSLRLDGRYPEDAAAALAALQRAAPDVMVVAAYGLILPRWVLVLPRHGCINIHGSLLPRWRGAAPIQRAIEAGDTETGITLMQMDEGLDTGAMLGVQLTPIQAGDTTGSLGERLAQMGAAQIVQALHALRGAGLHGQAQPLEGVNYAHKISKSEALIDWSEPAAVIERRVRAFDPAPGCSFLLDGRTVKLWRTRLAAGQGAPGQLLGAPEGRLVMACGEGALELLELQWPGGRRIAAHEFLKRRST